MKNLFKFIGWTGTLITLAGCIHFDRSVLAEPVQPVRSLYQQPCCDSLLSIQAQPVPANQYVTIVIDQNDPVLEFRKGISFTKAIQLPEVDGEYLLQLDSVVNIPALNLVQHAMYPMLTLLDGKLNPVAVYDQEHPDLRTPIFGPSLLRIIVTVPENSPAKYALIHTSPEQFKMAMPVDQPEQLVIKEGFDTMLYGHPTQSRKKIYFAETGMFNLLVSVK